MLKKYAFLITIFTFCFADLHSQVQEQTGPVLLGSAKALKGEPLSTKELYAPTKQIKIFNPKQRSANKVVPGKGYPKTVDAVWQEKMGEVRGKRPILTFDAQNPGNTPTDPTGAVGPNHYVAGSNSAFAIYDKEGNILVPESDLGNLGGAFDGQDLGDPIVFYDSFADRFVITQMSDSPNGLLVAVSQGPDPVNDGWYTYRFNTGNLPDYPKFYVWSDGYYVTTNEDPNDPDDEEVVYVLERDKMLEGESAQHIGFPLPGVVNNGFYSPAGFFAVGDELPPRGNAPLVYFQDDAWIGINEDHLKIWLVNVNWQDPASSRIELSQEIGPSEGITPFTSTFDGGSFLNLSQPGDTPDVDALQGAIMYPTCYRSFSTHNSVVFNFVVDVDGSQVEHAGIRWYELRQSTNGGPWSVYQEGTYAPDISDRWCGSIGMDENGNIGLGFSILNDNPENPILPSLKYTGRYAGDPLGVMTWREEEIAVSTVPDPSSRYGDYSHLSIDPVDGETFWFIGEYFQPGARLNKVGVFKIAPQFLNDVGIVDIVAPISSTLGDSEELTVTIRNFGELPQSNIPVSFSINGDTEVTAIYEGTIPSTGQVQYTFDTTADLSRLGRDYEITARTNLAGDEEPTNDAYETVITHLPPRDIGVTSIHSPETGENLGNEEVVVTIENFGGEPQSNFEVAYSLNGGEAYTETFTGVLDLQEEVAFTFSRPVDLSMPEKFEIFATTLLEDDSDRENDSAEKIVANLNCIPRGSDCGFGDGIRDFYLQDIVNENIYCTDGYVDFIGGFTTRLDRTQRVFEVGVSTGFSGNVFSLWIDFNDNAVFEEQEKLVSTELLRSSGNVYAFEFEIPEDAPLGEHIMRARAGDSEGTGNVDNPCSVMEYGTTHDYSVNIVSSIDESVLADASLNISSFDNETFNISLTAGYQQPLWLTVYDMLGQKLAENLVKKSVFGYQYELDMSYVSSGVYLVRMGTREEGKVQRVVVP